MHPCQYHRIESIRQFDRIHFQRFFFFIILVKTMYDFVQKTVGPEASMEIFETDSFDEVDLNAITISYLGIRAGYDRPLLQAKRAANSIAIDENDKTVQTIMKILEKPEELNKLIQTVDKSMMGRFGA